jgi:transposase-like protein
VPTPITIADPEVTEKTQRRRFTAEYKRRIVAEADKCRKPGELGALLRREGLYSSHLANWRAARDRDGKVGLEPKKRGPTAKAKPDDKDRKIIELECELAKARARAERAEFLVDMQKKMAQLLGREISEEETK